jgi:hypothetical protein
VLLSESRAPLQNRQPLTNVLMLVDGVKKRRGTSVNKPQLQYKKQTAPTERIDWSICFAGHAGKNDIGIQTHQLNWWKTKLGYFRLSAVSSAMISECRDELKKGQTHYGTVRSAATVNRYLVVLSHTFTIAWKEWDWINFNPVLNTRKLKEPRGRVRFLDGQERECLLNACRESRSSFLISIQYVYYIV